MNTLSIYFFLGICIGLIFESAHGGDVKVATMFEKKDIQKISKDCVVTAKEEKIKNYCTNKGVAADGYPNFLKASTTRTENMNMNMFYELILTGEAIYTHGLPKLSLLQSFMQIEAPRNVLIISGSGTHGIIGSAIAKKFLEHGVKVTYISLPKGSNGQREADSPFALAENVIKSHENITFIPITAHREISEQVLTTVSDTIALEKHMYVFETYTGPDVTLYTPEPGKENEFETQAVIRGRLNKCITDALKNIQEKVITIDFPTQCELEKGLIHYTPAAMVLVNFLDTNVLAMTKNTPPVYQFLKTKIVLVHIEEIFNPYIDAIALKREKSREDVMPNYTGADGGVDGAVLFTFE